MLDEAIYLWSVVWSFNAAFIKSFLFTLKHLFMWKGSHIPARNCEPTLQLCGAFSALFTLLFGIYCAFKKVSAAGSCFQQESADKPIVHYLSSNNNYMPVHITSI